MQNLAEEKIKTYSLGFVFYSISELIVLTCSKSQMNNFNPIAFLFLCTFLSLMLPFLNFNSIV